MLLVWSVPFWFRGADGVERFATWGELFGMLACYWSESTFFEWEQGDMLLLHNQLVAHNAVSPPPPLHTHTTATRPPPASRLTHARSQLRV